MAKPNLVRIPGDKDSLAEGILRRTEGGIDQGLLASLTDGDRRALGRYGVRMASVALRHSSSAELETALLAYGMSGAGQEDARDMMVGMSLHHVVAQLIGLHPGPLFIQIADRLPGGAAANAMRQFAVREDVSLTAFGWKLVDTPDGPDFCPV
ncbi:hypothetical protein [Streptomyces cylindrosporus]|uniref:Uncharacterized protein n=1 Tax=Streptomyces cylindrosporus TaxID=2927583 RepID=A0ABS9Y4N3_9ACTN|nr:hypothetical protein [Streptomyces cylindrosporus]MCI3272181.1 hypothetical protein [Streptomyces cylindrosporus]